MLTLLSLRFLHITDPCQCQSLLIDLGLLILYLVMNMTRVTGSLFQVFAGEENLTWLLLQTQVEV